MSFFRANYSIRSIFLLATFWTCFSTAFAQAPAPAQDDALRALPAPGKALVFVYRKDRIPLSAPVTAVVNSENLGQLIDNTYVTTTVGPGATVVRIGDGAPNTINFNAAPNRRYFVRVDALYGAAIVRTDVQMATEQDGLRALAQSRLAGEVPPVSAAAAPQPRSTANTTPPRRAPASESQAESGGGSEFALIVSTGSFTLAKADQVFAGSSGSYTPAAKSVLSVQAEWRSKTGLAYGAELFSFSNDIASSGAGADARQDAVGLLFNAKYYFRPSDSIRPFVGVGAGYASATYSGNLVGSLTGTAFQGLAGVELRWKSAVFHAQYKYLNATIGSEETLSVGGSGVLVGVGFVF